MLKVVKGFTRKLYIFRGDRFPICSGWRMREWPLIAGFDMGIAGAAWAMILAQTMAFFVVLLFIWAEPLVTLFISDEDSVAFGVSYLRTIALFYPFIGLNFILNGVVRGAGAMFQILALNIISLWLLRVPLAYWMISLYGESGIALGIGISFLISSLFSIAYYRWGGWRSKQLFT